MNDAPGRDLFLFTEALQLPAGERADFLDKACAGNVALRQKVETWLSSHEQIGDFLEEPVSGEVAAARAGNTAAMRLPDKIGRYKLLKQIGEGGCGVVYLAEQEEPVRRNVALKVIKPGMDSQAVIARFEAERQALALMDHPGIAKVFDAGATESGRPYFVMELIHGRKITTFCDENLLTISERLPLFIQVCLAVEHAHRKGIIHRDLKPSNILVSAAPDGTPLPSVIDFGIAKATTSLRLTDKTLFTGFEMLVGTPDYMSPEQAALTSVDVDTRSDIYSLGVLLYELLTGSTPFDSGVLFKSGLDEIRWAIREQDPPRPSSRLSRMSRADLSTLAGYRDTEPARLIRGIRGDLDWIVMKAMEKDRARRYETANGLAQDVKRFLTRETVSARPPGSFYKFQKAAQRNRLLFVSTGIIATLLVSGLIIVSVSLARERQARAEAEAGRIKAGTESAKSRQMTQFLKDMLEGVGPSVALGRDTAMLREILDRTAGQVERGMIDQPEVELELRSLVGRLYLDIGSYDRAVEFHTAALTLSRGLHGAQSEAAAAALHHLGNACWKLRQLDEAENAFQEALAIRRGLLGGSRPEVADTLNSLGNVFRRQRRLEESETLIREGLAIRQKLFGDGSLEVADSLRGLSMVLADQGRQSEAGAAAQEMLAVRRRRLGNRHYLTAEALTDVAWVMSFQGNSPEVEALETEAFEIRRQLLGDRHPDVAKSMYTLGERMRQRGNLHESHGVLNAALSIQRKLLDDDHPDVLATLRGLASTLEAEGKWEEAGHARQETWMLWSKRAGNESPQAVDALHCLVINLTARKKFDEAGEILTTALTPGFVKNPSCVNTLELRLNLLGRQARWREAAVDAALIVGHQPADHTRYHALAPLLVVTRDHTAHTRLCQEILARFGHTDNPYIADRAAKDCLLRADAGTDPQKVDQLADIAVTAGKGEISMPFFQTCKALSKLRQGEFETAIEWAEKPLAGSLIYAKAHACAVLAMAHWRLGRHDEALSALGQGIRLAPEIAATAEAVDLGEEWDAWLLARIQLDEAAALIKSGSVTDNHSAK